MGRYHEEDYEYSEEMQDEDIEESPEPNLEAFYENQPEVPLVEWAQEIKLIQDPEARQREIEAAEKIVEKETGLQRQMEAGEISESRYLSELEQLRYKKDKADTRCRFKGQGTGYEELGELSDRASHVVQEIDENYFLGDKIERISAMIEKKGPEFAQELADRMLEENSLSEDAYRIISEQVKEHRAKQGISF